MKPIEIICKTNSHGPNSLNEASKMALIDYALHLQNILQDIKNGVIEGVVIE
tara:strand:- start:846 stop:1001 length:156 start_codon:yes stop_codon:yes gene_type:complete